MSRGKELMSKTLKTVGITVLVLALTGGAIAGGMLLQKNHDEGKIEYPWENTSQSNSTAKGNQNGSANDKEVNAETTIKGSGVTIKALSTGVNDQGYTTKTFGYAVTPANATDQRIVVSMSWVDTSVTDQISAFFSWIVNTDAKTITIACKQDFGHQAVMNIASQSDTTKYATVTIDCLRKFRGFKDPDDFSAEEVEISLTGAYKGGSNTPSGVNYQKDYSEGFHAETIMKDGLGKSYTMADFHNGFSETFTKTVEYTFEASLARSTSWNLYAFSDAEVWDGTKPEKKNFNADFYSTKVSLDTDSSAILSYATIKAAVETAIASLSSDTRLQLADGCDPNNYSEYGFSGFGIKASTTLTIRASSGESESFAATARIPLNRFDISFLEPVTAIVPEVTGIDF